MPPAGESVGGERPYPPGDVGAFTAAQRMLLVQQVRRMAVRRAAVAWQCGAQL